MSYTVRDSRRRAVVESHHVYAKDAIAEAMKSGLDVVFHADDCPPYNPLSKDCPCKPTVIPGTAPKPLAESLFKPVRQR